MNPAFPLLILSLAAVGIGIAAAAVSTRKPLLSSSDRLYLIGDSLGVGLLPKLVVAAQKAGIAVAGTPVGGTNIQQWSRKPVAQLAAEFGATAVLIVLGTNDANSTAAYVQEVAPPAAHTLVRALKGFKVIWLAPGDTGALKHVKSIRAMLSALALSESITEYEIPATVEYSPFDNIHLTPAGYAQLAQWVVERTTSA